MHLQRNRIEMAGAKEINFAREGKVLRVLPSGRWVPRNEISNSKLRDSCFKRIK